MHRIMLHLFEVQKLVGLGSLYHRQDTLIGVFIGDFAVDLR
jgi:hypothetical protein